MKQIIYINKQGYSETHIFDNSGSIVSILNSDAYQQVSLSVTPEKTNEVVNYIAFAFVYGYNENEMTVDNAEVNISPLIQSSDDSQNESKEKEAVDEEVLSESIDKSKPYMQTSSEYDSTGNYVTSETNEQGSTTKYSYDANGNPLTYRDGMSMTWKNGRQLATLTNGDTSISYGYDSGSVRTTKTVNGVKYTYAYLNGQLLYETRGDAKFYYSYDANGILYNVRYTLTDGGTEYSYYYTHNSRGDIIGIYNGAGELKAHYEYDAWGNVISITDNNGNVITNPNHIGNLNPFRYRGYYQDTETGLYYLMSRYYDPVTHRFINADGYFQSGTAILDGNTFTYCANNPIYSSDPTGAFWGIVAGFCSGFISNTICQMISGTDISEINWGSALISGLTGAALGAVDVLGIGSIAGACIKGGISFCGSFADNVYKGDDFGTAVGGATVDGLTSLGFSSITRDLGGSHFSQEAVTKRKNWNFAASVGEKAYQYVRGSTSSVGESTGTGYKPAPKKQTQCRSCGRPIGKKYAWQCKYPTYY